LNAACAKSVANFSAPLAAIGIIQIRFVLTGSSHLRGIRATCRAASLPTLLKTSALAVMSFTSRNIETADHALTLLRIHSGTLYNAVAAFKMVCEA
jgi:hypothetical protein